MIDGWREVRPPSRAVERDLSDGKLRHVGAREHGGLEPEGDDDRDGHQRAEDGKRPDERFVVLQDVRPNGPEGNDDDWRQKRRDQGGFVTREHECGAGGNQRSNPPSRCAIDERNHREEVQRYPLNLRGVRMVGSLRQMHRREAECQRGNDGREVRAMQIPREREGGQRRQRKRPEHDRIESGDRVHRSRDRRSGHHRQGLRQQFRRCARC